jgi:hypothetical protein
MSTDVKAYFCSAATTITHNLARIRGFVLTNHGPAYGEVTFRDGTSAAVTSGNTFKVGINASSEVQLAITPLGVRMKSGLFLSVPTSCGATVFCDGG